MSEANPDFELGKIDKFMQHVEYMRNGAILLVISGILILGALSGVYFAILGLDWALQNSPIIGALILFLFISYAIGYLGRKTL